MSDFTYVLEEGCIDQIIFHALTSLDILSLAGLSRKYSHNSQDSLLKETKVQDDVYLFLPFNF